MNEYNKYITVIIALVLFKICFIFIKHANANSTNLNEIKNFETWQCKYDITRSPTKDRVFFELDKINLHHINVKTKDWIWRDHYKNRMFLVAKTKNGQTITITPKPKQNIDYYYMMDVPKKTLSMTAYDHKKKPGQQKPKLVVLFNCKSVNL